MKKELQVGARGYISQRTGNYYIDETKRPVTVVKVDNRFIYTKDCKLIFNGARYYDTIADEIKFDSEGTLRKFHWNEKKQRWICGRAKDYPYYLFTEQGWQHQPYLD